MDDKQWPSARYRSAVVEVLSDLRDGLISETDAVERIALIAPDCSMECGSEARIIECRDCNHWANMED